MEWWRISGLKFPESADYQVVHCHPDENWQSPTDPMESLGNGPVAARLQVPDPAAGRNSVVRISLIIACLAMPGVTAADDPRETAEISPAPWAQTESASEAIRPSARTFQAQSVKTAHDQGDPSDHEQLLIELINRARANPQAEVDRLGIDLNEGLPPNTLTPTPKQPLAFHPLLIEAARGHSAWMLEENVFSHYGEGHSEPGDRIAAALYPMSQSYAWGENIGWAGASPGIPSLTDYTRKIHDNLVKSPGHRENLMAGHYDELGLGILAGVFTKDGQDWNSVMICENFAMSSMTPGPLVTGVVYFDGDGDGFFSPGEGLPGVRVTPSSGNYQAITSASGGYAVPVAYSAAPIQLSFSGTALGVGVGLKEASWTGANLKVDFDSSRDPLLLQDTLMISSPKLKANGQFEFEVTGMQESLFEAQFSDDLKHWLPLEIPGGTLEETATILDAFASDSPHRYYRILRSN